MRIILLVFLMFLAMNCFGASKISELTDLTTGLQAADDLAIKDNSTSTTKRIGLDVLKPFFNGMYDTDSSHSCVLTWNEDDTSDRVLNFLVNGADRTLDLSENLTLADGYNFTLTAQDAAGSIVLDEQTVEFEGEGTATRLMKFVNGTNAAATLTINGTNGSIDQDVSTSGTPAFDQASTSGAKPVLTLDQADIDKDFIKLIGTATSGENDRSIVVSGDAASPAIEAYIKIYIEDVGNVMTDKYYYIPVYSIDN